MVEKYLKKLFEIEKIPFEENEKGFIIDCGGNPSDFLRSIKMLDREIESLTYELCLELKIEIDLAYEKIVVAL